MVASFVPTSATRPSAKLLPIRGLTTINDEEPVGSFVKFSRTAVASIVTSSRGGPSSVNGSLTTDDGRSLASFVTFSPTSVASLVASWFACSPFFFPPSSVLIPSLRSPLGSFHGYSSRAQLRSTSEANTGSFGASVSTIASAMSFATEQGSSDNGPLTTDNGPIDQ